MTIEKRDTRILCVDKSIATVLAVVSLLHETDGFVDAGLLTCANDLLTEVKRRRADLVLLNLTVGGKPPLVVISELKREAVSCRVIAYGAPEPTTVNAALDAGAWECLPQGANMELIEAVRRIASIPW